MNFPDDLEAFLHTVTMQKLLTINVCCRWLRRRVHLMLKIGSIFVDFTQIIWPPEEVIKKITISFNSCYYCYTKFWKLKLAHNERHSVDGQRKDKNRSLEWQRRSFKIILYFNLQARSMGGGQLRIKNCGEIIEINTKLTLKFSITSPPSLTD